MLEFKDGIDEETEVDNNIEGEKFDGFVVYVVRARGFPIFEFGDDRVDFTRTGVPYFLGGGGTEKVVDRIPDNSIMGIIFEVIVWRELLFVGVSNGVGFGFIPVGEATVPTVDGWEVGFAVF